MNTPNPELIVNALRQALADFGLRGASDPARLQGMLVDLLGSNAQGLASEVHAVVAACTLGVADALRADPNHTEAELIGRLVDTGTDVALATSAVHAWRTALAPYTQATVHSPVAVVEPTVVPAITESTVLPLDMTVLPAATVGAGAAVSTTADELANEPSVTSKTTGATRVRSRRLAAMTAIVVGGLVTSGIAWAASGDAPSGRVSGGTTTTLVTETTTTPHTRTTVHHPKPKPKPKPTTTTASKQTTTTTRHRSTTHTTPTTQAATTTTQAKVVTTTTTRPKPTKTVTKPKPTPKPTVDNVTTPVAADVYVSITSCWVNGSWESHYLGVTSHLPQGWTYVTAPDGQATNYGSLGYANGDFWYRPDSRYGGNYNDAFYYAYKNSSGVWSSWGIVHVSIDTSNSGC